LKSLGVETLIGGDLVSVERERKIDKLASRHNIPRVKREDLYSKCRAVVLAVPPKANHQLAEVLLLEGLDVYVQKPLVSSQANLLFKYAIAHNRTIMGGSDMAYRPDIIKARSLVARGDIGEPIYFHGRFCAKLVPSGWREDIVGDLGEHVTSVIREMMGTPDQGFYDRMSSVSGQFHFRGANWAADTRISWQSPRGSVPEIAVEGTDGTIEVNDGLVTVYKERSMKHSAKLWRWPSLQSALGLSKIRYRPTGPYSYTSKLERFLTACTMAEPALDFGVDVQNAEVLEHALKNSRDRITVKIEPAAIINVRAKAASAGIRAIGF
jgi:predicted dehydrogenase